MAKAGFKKRAYKASRSYRQNMIAMIMITMIVCVLLGVIIVKSNAMRHTIAENKAAISSLNSQIDAENKRTSTIEDEKEYLQSDEYYEKVAHDKIGLVYDNETVYKESN